MTLQGWAGMPGANGGGAQGLPPAGLDLSGAQRPNPANVGGVPQAAVMDWQGAADIAVDDLEKFSQALQASGDDMRANKIAKLKVEVNQMKLDKIKERMEGAKQAQAFMSGASF